MTGKKGPQVVGGMARQEILQRLGVIAVRVEMVEETRDGVGNFVGGTAIADGTRDGGDLADAAADTEVVGVDEFAIVLDFFAFEADIGNPMLTAGVGTAGDVELDVFLVPGVTLVELFGEPAGKGFCFGEREFAEFGTGASDGAANERVGENGKTGGVEGFDNGWNVDARDVDEEKILHRSGTEVAIAMLFSEVGGETDLRGSDAPTNDGSADGEEARLLLRDDAEMIAMEVGGKSFGFGGIEFVAEFGFDGGEEGVGGPTVLEEEIF